jgi:DHA1 family tetracycline resistance protein-like MFS transporter
MPNILSNQFTRFGRFLRSPLFPIFMIVFVDVLGLGITIPVLPLYAQNIFGATATQITLLSSAYFAAQFLASPRLGRLSDRVGRRPVLILSQSGTFTALLVSGLAQSLPFLFLARTIDGLTGGNISVAQAYLSDITDEKNRARGMGIVNASFGSGFIFGPAFGALMAAHFGPRVPFFVAAAVSLVTILLSYFLLPESLTRERRQPEAARRASQPQLSAAERRSALLRAPGVILIMVIALGGQLAFFSFQSTWVLWAEQVLLVGYNPGFVQQAVGFILTFVGVCGVITQAWLVGPLVRRFGEKAMVPAGTFARGLAWGLMAAFPWVGLIVAVAPLIAVGGGISLPALIAMLTYAAPPGQRGYAIGTLESVQSLGRIVGPLLAGALFERVHPSAPLAAAALITALTVVASFGLWQVKSSGVEPERTASR